MKIYIVNVKRYYYWKDACTSGYRDEKHYFINKDKAEQFIALGEAVPYQYGIEGKPVPSTDKYNEPHFELEEAETED